MVSLFWVLPDRGAQKIFCLGRVKHHRGSAARWYRDIATKCLWQNERSAKIMASDPFHHLPDLRGMILDPARSFFRDLDIAAMDRKMEAAGKAIWRRSDAEREATRQAALAGRLEHDLWVFAYGSLMWDPAFYFAEVRSAHALGYQRDFCLKSELGRGSPENPGLMAGLNKGDECNGLAFRIAGSQVDEETRVIWSREMIMKGYDPRFIALTTPQGPVEALTFIVDQSVKQYMAGLTLEDAAAYIATGTGIFGPNLAYLDNLAEHFETLGIEDERLFKLHRLATRLAGRAGVE